LVHNRQWQKEEVIVAYMKKPTKKAAAFKPCKGCPAPAKCKAAKKCMKKR
jgi:hypothetical protein